MTVRGQIERLIAAMQSDRTICDQLAKRLAVAVDRAPWASEDPILYLVAVTLDHYYSATESLIERVTRAFEGLPDRGERWHKELLQGASFALPGIRAAVLSSDSYKSLLRLLEFRHFLRHAYAVALDPEQLLSLAHELFRARPTLEADLDAFVEALRTATTD